jgi:hypothetical protein
MISTLAACTPSTIDLSPPIDPSAHALLVAVEGADARLTVTAIDPVSMSKTAWVRGRYEAPATVTVLSYAETLATLGISAGPIADAAPNGRMLAGFKSAYQASVRAGEAVEFEPIATLEGALAAFQLPPRMLCFGDGICPDLTNGDPMLCRNPCPAPPAPDPVVPPRNMPPVAPDPPQISPCTSGWTEGQADGIAICDPWPNGTPPPCPMGQVAFPGSLCARIGTACSTDHWATDLPTSGAIVYALAGAAPNGNGTRAAPYARVQDAIAHAPPNAVVALADTTFTERVTLANGVTLWGACPESTVLTASSGTVLFVDRNGGTIKNLSVSGGDDGLTIGAAVAPLSIESVVFAPGKIGIGAFGAAAVIAHDIVVQAPPDTAIVSASSASVAIDRLFVDGGKQALSTDGASSFMSVRRALIRHTTGGGGQAENGGRLVVRDSVFLDDANFALASANAGTTLVADGLLVRGTRSADQVAAITSYGRSRGSISRSRFEDNQTMSIELSGAAGDLRDVLIRDPFPDATGHARGIAVAAGATLSMSRTAVLRSADVGIAIADSNAAIEDLTLIGTMGAKTDARAGLILIGTGTISVRRAVFDGNLPVGVSANGTNFHLTGITIRRSSGIPINGESGGAITLLRGTHAWISEALIDDNQGVGIDAAISSAGSIVLTDTIVSNTKSADPTIDASYGIRLYRSSATGARLKLVGNENAAITVSGTCAVALSDVETSSTATTRQDATSGHGIVIDTGATVHVIRVKMFDNRSAAARVSSAGSVLELDHADIETTRADPCLGDLICGEGDLNIGGGAGFLARGGGRLIANVFISRDNVRGIALGFDSARTQLGILDLHQGLVEKNVIGFETIGAMPVDLAFDRVLFRDNQALSGSR